MFVFFFKQKTAYEMRISDWSSDVCSSDLFGGDLVARLDPGVERDVGVDALTLDIVREADDRGLGDILVQYQRAFDFGGAHAVARDVDDVVDAPGDPPIAFGIAAAAVAGEIFAFVGRKISLGETLVDRKSTRLNSSH